MSNLHKVLLFRRGIPKFACIPGCHDCCGPIMASPEEMARLPPVAEAQRASAMEKWDCPHLGATGCQVYHERPLVCRLFGTTPRLTCPHGRQPDTMIDARLEMEIEVYLSQVRHVLV